MVLVLGCLLLPGEQLHCIHKEFTILRASGIQDTQPLAYILEVTVLQEVVSSLASVGSFPVSAG